MLALTYIWFALLSPIGHAIHIPELRSEITDGAALLNPGDRRVLRQQIEKLNAEKNIQLAVLIVSNLEDMAIESYALEVAEKWKLGKKGEDRGVLLLIAPKERRMRFEVGYGLEGDLSDIVTKRILSDTLGPLFKQGKYAQGIQAAVENIQSILSGEKPKSHKPKGGIPAEMVVFFLILIIVFVFFLQGFFIPPPGYRRGRDWDDWGSGGWGGGGGGGFSGGGGSFGGGGSSSSW